METDLRVSNRHLCLLLLLMSMNTARFIATYCESSKLHLPLGIPNKGGRDEVQIGKGFTNR